MRRTLLRDAFGYAMEELAARRRDLVRLLMWEIGALMLSYMRGEGLNLAPQSTAAKTALQEITERSLLHLGL